MIWPMEAFFEPAKKTDGSELGLTIMGSIVQKDTANNVMLVKEQKSGKVRAVKAGHRVFVYRGGRTLAASNSIKAGRRGQFRN